MTKYFAQRLLLFPPALMMANFVGFAYARLAQRVQLARNPFIALEGSDLPLFEDYGVYLRTFFAGEFGNYPGTDVGLLDYVWQLSQNTIGLLMIAFISATVLGLLLGLQATKKRGTQPSFWLTGISTFGQAMPGFYAGSLLIVASLAYAMAQPNGTPPPFPLMGFGYDIHLVLPTIALMFRPMGQIAKFTATSLLGELDKQYVVAARSTGHTWRDVRWRLAMKNILAQVMLTIISAFRFILVEMIVVEWLFNWKGIGQLFAQTLVPSNMVSLTGTLVGEDVFLNPQIIALLLMIFVLVFLLSDLVASAFGHWVDPRLRLADEVSQNVN